MPPIPRIPVATGQSRQPTTRRPRFRPFKPYVARPVPTGLYDPSLDAARRAASRGLSDLTNDVGYDPAHGIVGLQAQRDITDYQLARQQAQQGFQRGSEDISSQLAAIRRGYQVLQSRQGQQINAAGGTFGGARLQAAARRTANQAIDTQPLVTSYTRLAQDTQTQLGQLALDYAPPDASNPFGGRRYQDRALQLARAKRENTQFGLDTQAEKAYQASADPSYNPSSMPANERVDAQGHHYRVVNRGERKYWINPQGQVIKRKWRYGS